MGSSSVVGSAERAAGFGKAGGTKHPKPSAARKSQITRNIANGYNVGGSEISGSFYA
jgi:hypothetical protein